MTDHRKAAEAVHRILSALEESLREDEPLPRDLALFCADCFEKFVKSKVWRGAFLEQDADEEFAAVDRSQESTLDLVLGTSARLSEARLRKIATAFCIAFGLSRHPTKPPMLYPKIPRETGGPPESPVEIPRQSVSYAPTRVIVAAESGDPGALRRILTALVTDLRGGPASPRRYELFCADSLRTLLEHSKAWEAISRRNASTNDRRIFGRAVCRALHLSKSQATLEEGDCPRLDATSPAAVHKFQDLLLYGVSQRSATAIILTAFRRPRHRSLTDWQRIMKIQSAHTGTLGEHLLVEHRLELADQVERANTSRRSLEQAYSMVARSLAAKLFPDFRAQFGRWATRILLDARRRPRAADQVELARRVRAAIEQGQRLPRVSHELSEKILPRIRAGRATTRLPESAVRELLPAVREAHRFALSLPAQ